MYRNCKFNLQVEIRNDQPNLYQSALTQNITTDQAFCIISQCLSQVKQSPVWLGRKKRESEDDIALEQQNVFDKGDIVEVEEGAGAIVKPISETIEIAVNGTTHKFHVVSEVTVDISPEDSSEGETWSHRIYDTRGYGFY